MAYRDKHKGHPVVGPVGMGILPGEWDFMTPQNPLRKALGGVQKTLSPLDQFLNKPGGSMLMNLLAQSGYGPTPGPGPLGAIGRAWMATQQQQQARSAADLQRQLIESQIGLNQARASGNLSPTAKPPASIAEYNLYKEQAEAAGKAAIPFEDWVKELARLRATGTALGAEDVRTPAEKAIDDSYGTTYVDWTQGGQADALKGLSQLREVRNSLREAMKPGSKINLTGPGIGLTPDKALPYLNQEAANAKDLVEEVVQRNLRIILGAQFTEREGERLIARAYNPALEESKNAERLDRLIAQMEVALAEKQKQAQYFLENGTLKGWQGKVYTIEDFEKVIESIGDKSDASTGSSGKVRKRYNPDTGLIETVENVD